MGVLLLRLVISGVVKFHFVNEFAGLGEHHEPFEDFHENVPAFNISGHVNLVLEIIYKYLLNRIRQGK